MNWITVYISGKAGFREEVKRRLEHSDLNFMPGSVEGSAHHQRHDLYWLDDQTDMQAFKKAIGSKLIWKYRLRFFDSLENFTASQEQKQRSAEFSTEELHLISSMKRTVEKQKSQRDSFKRNKVAA